MMDSSEILLQNIHPIFAIALLILWRLSCTYDIRCREDDDVDDTPLKWFLQIISSKFISVI